MAHSHEKITYGTDELKELFDACVLTGTIIDVDYDNDKADVNIDNLGQIDNVPIFYHCEGENAIEGGAAAFSVDDNVYILNKKGKVGPGASSLKIVGFVDGLKGCGFYIDVKVNNICPKYWKTLKLIDAEGKEHKADSNHTDPDDPMYDKPWKVGPFVGVKFPAQVFLGASSGNPDGIGSVSLFNYFYETTETPPWPHHRRHIKAWTRPCYQYNEFILYELCIDTNCFESQPSDYTLSAIPIRYILHEDLLLSKPQQGDEVEFDFDVKMVGRLQTKFSEPDFGIPGQCLVCNKNVIEKTFENDPEDVDYVPNVSCVCGYKPPLWIPWDSCPPHCVFAFLRPSCNQTCRKAQAWVQNGYNGELSNYGHIVILSDRDGRNPRFDDAEIVLKFYCHIVVSQYEINPSGGCGDLDYNVCSEVISDPEYGHIMSFKMVPTWEKRI